MEIHRLTFGVVAVFGDTRTRFAQHIIGGQSTVARDQLNGLTRFQQRLEAVELIEKVGIDTFDFIGAVVTEKWLRRDNSLLS